MCEGNWVQEGEVDIVISGGSGATHKDDDIVESKGAQTVVRKGAGWTFGVLTLLFRAPRSASVVAHTGVTVMAMDRRTFISFVMTHAKGARATCFLRKLPLLQGLADDRLMEIASRVKQEVYEAGEHLIHAGDHADALYIIRYFTCCGGCLFWVSTCGLGHSWLLIYIYSAHQLYWNNCVKAW